MIRLVGAIVVALLAELREARGTATDISAAALATGRRNAERHGVAGRIRFQQADFASEPNGPFDVVVSNPPYVASGHIGRLDPDVGDFDPHNVLSFRVVLPGARYDTSTKVLAFHNELQQQLRAAPGDQWSIR